MSAHVESDNEGEIQDPTEDAVGGIRKEGHGGAEDDTSRGSESVAGAQSLDDETQEPGNEGIRPQDTSGGELGPAAPIQFSEDDESREPPAADKIVFEDEGLSLDAISEDEMQSEEINRQPEDDESRGADRPEPDKDNRTEDKDEGDLQTLNDGNDSNSRPSTSKQAKSPSVEDKEPENGQVLSLMTDEIISDEDDSEHVVEVDISSMMEVNMDEESQNSQTNEETQDTGNSEEPEVIPIESDDDSDQNKQSVDASTSNNESVPILMNVNASLFEVDDEDNVTEVDISSMMQVEVAVDERQNGDRRPNEEQVNQERSTGISRRPRRAAAEAAAKTIHQISAQEQGEPLRVFRQRRKSQEDTDYNVDDDAQVVAVKQKCHACKKSASCSIVVRQYGSDLYLCSNSCFSKFRNQGKDCKSKSLPCSKCGIINNESSSGDTIVYFWETMNFCSDLCVGRYQMDVGSKCCTCGNNVPWNSLGKYCVRFGSDIRQFCMPQCLEGYKKNARVCFNCQLDIRRVGNVILANIPSKAAPKEFCSNDCVEMYCDRNLHQPTRAKPPQEHVCAHCRVLKSVHKELVLTSGSFKTCSEYCFQKTLTAKGVSKGEKCEMCTKFVNMDLGFTTPVYWLSAVNKVFGFCSHICKNLFILNSRKILACTTCKVKKYNYDLVELFKNSSSSYAVCSLACLPKGIDYLHNIRDVLYLPEPTSDKTTMSISDHNQLVPVINSVTSMSSEPNLSRRRPRTRRMENRETLTTESSNDKDIVEENYEEDIDVGDPVNFLESLTVEQLDVILNYIDKPPPEMSSKMVSVKPRTRTIETQTDVSELNEMDRIPLKSEEIVHYIPVPIPCLIDIPFPGYFLEAPVPIPFPMPIPFPVPIPVILPTEKTASLETLDKTESNTSVEPEIGKNVNSEVTATKDAEHSEDTPVIDISAEIQSLNNSDLLLSDQPITIPSHSTSTTDCDFIQNELASDSNTNVLETLKSPTFNTATTTASYSTTSTDSASQYSSSIPAPGNPTLMNLTPMLDYGVPLAPVIPPQTPPTYAYQQAIGSFGGIPDISSSISTIASPSPGSFDTHLTPSVGYINSSPLVPASFSPAPLPVSTILPQNTAPKNNRVEYALRAWKSMFGTSSDPRSVSSMELASKLTDLVNRGSKPTGERYRADILLYISLGIQQMLRDYNRMDKVFYDNMYYNFVLAFTECAERELTVGIHASIDEINFWESSELGASSPGVLLFTLIFLFQKWFGLKTWEMQAALQFDHVVVQSRYDQFGMMPVKYLTIIGLPGAISTEVQEDISCPDRCLVKIYEFYRLMSESTIGPLYKCLRPDYTARTPWFTSQRLDQLHIYQMLVRASMIKNHSSSVS